MQFTKSRKMNRTRSLLAGIVLAVVAVQTINSPVLAGDEHGFVSKKYDIKGGWQIVEENGKTLIRFDKSFKTKGGPDLKVFLSPLSIADVSGKTATDNSIQLGKLQSITGSQDYILPDGLSLEDYNSILVHCEQYSVLWGGSDLHAAKSN
ncbi:DM13 domain-containing protein [Granulosicoccus antarcticus]|uniref:DM13 domain-containing protein n=1 Tax=Granulosicoccus antarcticus IMCC3135 TaxID=1192854 RepID=A0A2Z2NIK3_9GAMM|nr:DM13 domain-containing protein [Granulosicoccus antarcticus]ASJ70883.1 hypothetical protein IMCC3135_03850 [Granulosicoccus antarcticus IMCC3135]